MNYEIRFEVAGIVETWGGKPGRLWVPVPSNLDELGMAVKQILAVYPTAKVTIQPTVQTKP